MEFEYREIYCATATNISTVTDGGMKVRRILDNGASMHICNDRSNIAVVSFRGNCNVAKVARKSHLVQDLKTKLFIGMESWLEGLLLDLEQRTARIAAYMGLTFLISLHAKSHHQQKPDLFEYQRRHPS